MLLSSRFNSERHRLLKTFNRVHRICASLSGGRLAANCETKALLVTMADILNTLIEGRSIRQSGSLSNAREMALYWMLPEYRTREKDTSTLYNRITSLYKKLMKIPLPLAEQQELRDSLGEKVLDGFSLIKE